MAELSFKKDDTPKTYGEKMHHNIFDVGLNFGVNFIASAAISYWMAHSVRPMWKGAPFAKEMLNKPPKVFYDGLVRKMEALPIMKAFSSDGAKKETAKAMANILVLTTGGHGVMIPSVWLGEKYKGGIVRHFDKQHYGSDEMQPDWVKERHYEIETAPKPSLLGSVTGRAGTVLATQVTAYTVGSNHNVFKYAGNKMNVGILKKFTGLDDVALQGGGFIGNQIAKVAPKPSRAISDFMRNRGYSYSTDTVEAAFPGLNKAQLTAKRADTNLRINGDTYNTAVQDWSRFFVLDALYTAVTAITIGPIVGFLKNHIPGMSYTQEAKTTPPSLLATQATNGSDAAPAHKISNAQSQGVVNNASRIEVSIA